MTTSKPFITINIQSPPTIHQSMTLNDVLTAAESLKMWALNLPLQTSGGTDYVDPRTAKSGIGKESK